MNSSHLAVLLIVMTGSLIAAPDLEWALASLLWSALGFLAGVGCGWLLWGRRKDTER